MGSALGSSIGAIGGLFGPKSAKGSHVEPHKVDREKFKIEGLDDLKKRALAGETAAGDRSKFATGATQGLIGDLQAQSRGQGPSLAGLQLKQAQDRSLAQQLAAVQAGRPQNAALAARQVMRNASNVNQQTAQQAAMARMQEQLNAQQLLGQTAGREQALSDQLTQGYLDRGFNMAQAQQQANAQAELAQQDLNAGAQGLSQQMFRERQGRFAQAGQAAAQGIAEGLASGGGGGGIMSVLPFLSDENAKKNVKSANKDMDDFLSALSAKGYKYKDTKLSGTRKGKNYGIVAQDLEKSKVGKTMVHNTPNGKMVDMQKGFGAVLAAQARMNSRMQELEKLLGKKDVAKDKKRG